MKHILLCLFACTTAHAVTPTINKAFKDFCMRAKILAQQQEEHDARVMQTFKLSPRDQLKKFVFEPRQERKNQTHHNKDQAQHST
jgi:hypothetical protein